MKGRIPSDVDRLMWLVAESNDPKAISDFENRFSEFSTELARRRRMVTELKGAKGVTAPDHPIPAFKLRGDRLAPMPRAVWVMAVIAFASLALASFTVYRYATLSKTPIAPPTEVVTGTPSAPDTTVYKPIEPNPTQQNSVQAPVGETRPEQQTVPPNNDEIPKTLKLSNTSLIAALKMIGEMAGYRVEVAPGFEDQQVSIDYDQITTSDMLKDLGLRYGFTPFDQGDGSIIIVPAVDSGADDTNGSQRRIGG